MDNLSAQAQEIVMLMGLVDAHAETESHLHDDEGNGRKWLAMCNINNGHEEATTEYTDLMSKLSNALNGYLIDSKGQHSEVYYELKKAGYRLRVGESDGFGPLSAVFTAPSGNWQVCYG